MTPAIEIILLIAGCCAGAQNALAGGGTFISLAALMLAGLDARSANIISTIALYPGQVAAGVSGCRDVSGVRNMSFRSMSIIGGIGGAAGAIMLLWTPSAAFTAALPWLVLFSTALFAWSAFHDNARVVDGSRQLPIGIGIVLQAAIALYGGYFGGGLGFLLVAALSLIGLAPRTASATKNALSVVINSASVLVLVFSPAVVWRPTELVAVGALVGGLGGAWALQKISERALRYIVLLIAALLTAGLFLK